MRTVVFDPAWELPFAEGSAARVIREAFTEVWHERGAECDARLMEMQRILAEDDTAIGLWAGHAAAMVP